MQALNEEIIYCTACGAVNERSAVVCSACEKQLNRKGSPFRDFLKDHIKEALQDNISENIFSLIKNFLLSHLYGTILTLCVIATICMSIYAGLPPEGVKTVKLHPEIAAEQKELAASGTEAFSEDELAEVFYTMMDDYDLHAAFGEDVYTAEDGVIPQRSVENLFAEHALPGYTYSATHDFLDGSFHTEGRALASTYDEISGMCIFDFETLHYNADAETTLGKQLYRDGYSVAEIICNACWISGYHGEETSDAYIVENATRKIVYQFTFIEEDGKWYIANDIRL